MVLSLVRACVRHRIIPSASTEHLIEERRAPLDAARNVLLSLEATHGIPLEAIMVNPLASAYLNIGLPEEASKLIHTALMDRSAFTMETTLNDPGNRNREPVYHESVAFNINDMHAKDRVSYNILIEGALSEGDWATAISSLKNMTQLDLYPNSRTLNRWNERAMKRERNLGSFGTLR